MTDEERQRLNRLRLIFVGRGNNCREVFNLTGDSFYGGAATAYGAAAREIQTLLDNIHPMT